EEFLGYQAAHSSWQR
ncbi:unnamed protein product, partial [Allacma fusca]